MPSSSTRLISCPRIAIAGEDDADLYAALDDLSDTLQTSKAADQRTRSADDDFAAALDEWSTGDDDGRGSDKWGIDLDPTGEPASSRRRVRPEDLELSSAEHEPPAQQAARRISACAPRRACREPHREPQHRRAAADQPARWDDFDEDQQAVPSPWRLSVIIPLVILLLFLAFAAFWFLSNRTTFSVVLPASAMIEHPFTDEVIRSPAAPTKAPPPCWPSRWRPMPSLVSRAW